MFKKFVSLLFCFLIFTQCAPKSKLKIGVSVATMQESVYSFMKDAIFKQAKKDNVKVVWLSANNNEANQAANIEDLLTQKVNSVIIHPVNSAASGILVHKIKKAGIPVIAMDRLPQNAPVDIYVTANSYKVGQIQAEFLAKKIGYKGNVIILQGEAGNDVAREITRGNLDVLKKYPGIKIVVNQMHKNWARELAMATTEDALTRYKNNIAGILANNSGMAMGAVQALKAQGLIGKVVCIGSDADFDACQSIINGELTADVDKKPIELGLESYKAALKLIRKEKVSCSSQILNGKYQVKVKLIDVELITKENVKEMRYRWPNL